MTQKRNPVRWISILTVFFPLLHCLQACASFSDSDGKPVIKAIEINAETIQREKISFSISNYSIPQSSDDIRWEWLIIDAESGKIADRSHDFEPTLSLPQGTYDITLTAHGKNELTRHFRRYITVLPRVFPIRKADEVIDLSKVKGEHFVKDYGNKKRPGYKIVLKGTYNGRIKFTGLRGTKKNPVHIINEGQVVINATNNNSPYAWLWSNDNQYVLIDGKADPKIPYGFKITGHQQKSGQILFIGGKFQRGFEVCGVHLIGNQGVTHGASAIQVQTSYSADCNADNWTFEYFKAHHNKIERASSEGLYLGYFTDEVRDTGFAPYRMGKVIVYRDTIIHSGWDAIQIASADEFEVHDNYVDGASLSGKRSHSSFLSWNNGNKEGWVYRNTFKNSAHAASIFFGETGKDAYLYSNLFVEGTFPDNIDTPGFIYTRTANEHEDVGLYIFHNTIITSRISAKVDYRNSKENTGIPIIYAANAILQNRANNKRYSEIAMGSKLQDSTYWIIDNVWRMKEKETELLWDEDFKPQPESPLIKSNFDITRHITKLKGGYYDRDGYPLKHKELGYTAGCFSAHQLSTQKQKQNGLP